jgi:ABC-2 type transport system ATP-binding protein
MSSIIHISNLSKIYSSGFQALKDISLEIKRGEIFALLGPNGAGKTTLISVICGIVNKSSGAVLVDGNDTVSNFRAARKLIGLVPQELHLSIFETVWDTVKFSRKLFGRADDDVYLEKILKQLSLWEKKDSKIMTLSGGMKRRVLIAKALSHEPKILFLDEPSAGVDVELRKDMWNVVRQLQANGVTIILTTHYIEEAEEMADRVGVITKGGMILVDDKTTLMKKMGQKKLTLTLDKPIAAVPKTLAKFNLALNPAGDEISYIYDAGKAKPDIAGLLNAVQKAKLNYSDVHTAQNSLEDIFMGLVKK